MLIILAIKSPYYFNIANFKVLGQEMAQLGIASTGTTMLIIAGYVDLSIGSLLSLTAVLAAITASSIGSGTALTLGVVVGGCIGLFNGLLVWRIRISPLIVTLGMLTLLAGVADLLGQSSKLLTVPASFAKLGSLSPLGIPIAVWVMLAAFVLVHFTLNHTVVGRHIYAIGGNREAAVLAGVRVRRIVLTLFAVSGLIIGLAAILTASRFGTASSNFGTGFELQVITAVILGGVAFQGGEGSAFGVFLGVVLLTVISSGLVSLGVNPFYTNIVQGGVLVFAVAIDQLVLEQRERHRRAVAIADAAADREPAGQSRHPPAKPSGGTQGATS